MLTASLFVMSVLAVPQQPQAKLELKPLRGLPQEVPLPEGTKFDADIAALGRSLFFDDILSVDHKTTCASCHKPGHGFASVEALPPGSLGQRAKRNAPTLYNWAYGKAFSWDGKAKTLEKQVILPISNPVEMALPLKDALQRLRRSDRSLVEKHANNPFTLIGINSDRTIDRVKKAIEKNGINWRSFWEGTTGKISTKWNVRGWPTVVFIDHKGKIRYRAHSIAHDLLEKLIEEAKGDQ